MRRIKKLEKQVEEFANWIQNMSAVQDQLLKELGYKIKWKRPSDTLIYIEKIEETRIDDSKNRYNQ